MSERVRELTEIRDEMLALLDRARAALSGAGMAETRAESYWLDHIEGAIGVDGNHGSMFTLQDTIEELGQDD